MKKINPLSKLFVFSICFANALFISGQTLTCETNCPKEGEMFSMRTSSPIVNWSGTSAGTNQVWNYSVISTAVSPITYLISYQPASSVPSASLYPHADLVKKFTYYPQTNTFLTVDSGGVRRVSPITASVNIDAMELPLPFAYGDSYNETVTSTTFNGTDTIVTTWQNSFLAYGSGTLLLPSGSFPDVLAIKLNSTQTTTKKGSAPSYVYFVSHYFYSQHIRHYLLYAKYHSIDVPGNYSPNPNEFLDHIAVGLTDELTNNSNEMVVSPNPAGDIVNIKLSKYVKGKIKLKNSLGQLLLERNYEEGCSMNLSALPEGMYVISIVGGANNINKKLVIRR